MNWELETIGPRYEHVYLSPHPDDAVLSCGGTIARQVAVRQPVLVVNLFVAIPDYSTLSAWAQVEHRVRGNPPDLLQARLAQDSTVLASLGASVQNLHYLDCIYRRQDGRVLYDSVEAIFGEVAPVEYALISQLTTDLLGICAHHPSATVYAPFGAGHHVDHQLTRSAALILIEHGHDVRLYEDFPYAEEEEVVASVLAGLPGRDWQPDVREIDVEAKIGAIAGYTTEMDILFGGQELMPQRVRAFAARVGQGQRYAERFWVPCGTSL